MNPPSQSSLALLFPEIERYTDTYRLKHDPSAQHGFPPHVSVIWPFIPPELITEETLQGLESFVGRFPKLDLVFHSTGHSPTGLYLRPEPREPLVQMILAAMKRYPDYPPYRVANYQPNPHVTIAHEKDPQKLKAITEAFEREIEGFYPIRARVDKVWLLEEHGSGWKRMQAFDLA